MDNRGTIVIEHIGYCENYLVKDNKKYNCGSIYISLYNWGFYYGNFCDTGKYIKLSSGICCYTKYFNIHSTCKCKNLMCVEKYYEFLDREYNKRNCWRCL